MLPGHDPRAARDAWILIYCETGMRKAVSIAALIVFVAGVSFVVMYFANPEQDRRVLMESGDISHEAGDGGIAIMNFGGRMYLGINVARTSPDQRQSLRERCKKHGIWTGRIIEFSSP